MNQEIVNHKYSWLNIIKSSVKIKALVPVHVIPFPEYPGMHAQWKEPLVLEQFALAWQLCEASVHSFTSAARQT